jgi:PIN domain nuclease of toxin-antitoxin system
MVVAIADTHTTLWYLFSDPRLGRAASAFIDATVAGGDHIGVSAISVAEMVYLTEKGRIPATALTDVQTAVADPNAVLRYVPVDEDIAVNMAAIPREDVPDLPCGALQGLRESAAECTSCCRRHARATAS